MNSKVIRNGRKLSFETNMKAKECRELLEKKFPSEKSFRTQASFDKKTPRPDITVWCGDDKAQLYSKIPTSKIFKLHFPLEVKYIETSNGTRIEASYGLPSFLYAHMFIGIAILAFVILKGLDFVIGPEDPLFNFRPFINSLGMIMILAIVTIIMMSNNEKRPDAMSMVDELTNAFDEHII